MSTSWLVVLFSFGLTSSIPVRWRLVPLLCRFSWSFPSSHPTFGSFLIIGLSMTGLIGLTHLSSMCFFYLHVSKVLTKGYLRHILTSTAEKQEKKIKHTHASSSPYLCSVCYLFFFNFTETSSIDKHKLEGWENILQLFSSMNFKGHRYSKRCTVEVIKTVI